MKDNFDLKKFLVENKTIENSNPFLKENQYEKDAEADDAEHIDALEKDMADDKKSSLRERIREMIINELSEDTELEEYDSSTQMIPDENEDGTFDISSVGMKEAKEDEEEEEVEAEEEEVTDEEGGEEEVESEETEEVDVETGGGLEDIAADMEGDEGDLMDHLISALKVSKAIDNEKLTTQIGNTLKFFVGEYIGGEE
jgi:hypothetical protein